MNLGTESTFRISLQSQGYNGIVSLKSDLTALKALDAALNPFLRSVVIRFKLDSDPRAVEQLEVPLSAGQSIPVTVFVEVDSRGPDFNNLFKLQLATADGKALDSEDILLEIKNIYEMRLFTGPVDAISPSRWSHTKDAYLRRHTAGINLMFVNFDPTDNHIVHSNNTQLFPHEQGQGMSPALNATTPNPNGGTFNTLNSSAQANLAGTYYLHNEDDDAGLAAAVYTRSITINSTTMIPTFARIKSEIIDRKCIACHGAASANGSLATAADIRAQIVTKFGNNAEAFIGIFTGASGYLMPRGALPLTIDEQHYFADYIRSGAPN
jgi:hypothetical protein